MSLQYSNGKYKNSDLNHVEQRVDTITNFLKTARKDLKSYDVQTCCIDSIEGTSFA